MNKLRIPRSERKIRGTSFRPIAREWELRESKKSIRRISLNHDGTLKIATRNTVSVDRIPREQAATSADAVDVAVESPYKRGKYEPGYLYFPLLRIVSHHTSAEQVWQDGNTFGPGALIGKHVRIEGSHVGAWSEVGNGAVVLGSQLGDNVQVRQRSIVEGSQVGANSYVGIRSRIALTAIGGFYRGGKLTEIREASVGAQATIRAKSNVLGPSIEIHDSFTAGQELVVGPRTLIGEQVTVGKHNLIKGRSMIGAESRFGDYVRVAAGVFLVSPTYAEDWEFIKESNAAVGGLDIGRLFNDEQE